MFKLLVYVLLTSNKALLNKQSVLNSPNNVIYSDLFICMKVKCVLRWLID